ncbi:ABC transporter ATP-binding protein [Cohnella nanjingensis]|uniref:ABC transporter ATP-binding protein n=2 Tax=Cohnella nanjingensis TaxID=1387779 RepID=A0A7X0VHJ9_9BACL|nr:ABC transporter ATP-binding protein [Cohnella nanjingensis]
MTFGVRQGEIFGIVGPNGAGKTTLIEMIEGLRTPDGGQIEVLGLDVGKHREALKQRYGVLLQSTSIPGRAKVRELLQLFSSFYRKTADVEQLSRSLRLDDKQQTAYKSLSGGWKQRVSLALALINDPEIVFLDEPSMGLDPNARSEMWEMIVRMRNEGRTIVVTTHYMEEAEALCDRIAVIDKGRLVALDTPRKLIARLGGNRRISFRNPGTAAQHRLSSLPYVVQADWLGEEIVLHSSNLDQTLKHLFRLAESENWLVSELRLGDATMNDVFSQLTLQERRQAQ